MFLKSLEEEWWELKTNGILGQIQGVKVKILIRQVCFRGTRRELEGKFCRALQSAVPNEIAEKV